MDSHEEEVFSICVSGMAPKKRTHKSGSKTRFDHWKFVSTDAIERHMQFLVHKVLIQESGIDLNLELYSFVHKVITRWQWEKFCDQPEAAVLPRVYNILRQCR
ncbi:Uncharacterized protein TCM_003416 [Theobroma cacao]|uniref:Uncharacterized protein n=1 Tax=Theobroma cacao TaxID=3641 RepID=A0A061DVW5_THECC|nr:Uncharacterized protein TCM_003416 [Theobroma cacao]